MALTPDEFYAHALAGADAQQRLPLARMTEWEISPFEQQGLRVSPLRPPVVPEPPRHGEDPANCVSCHRRDEGLWLDEHWRVSHVSGSGCPSLSCCTRAPITTSPTCPTTAPPSSASSRPTWPATSRSWRTSPAATSTASATATPTCTCGSSLAPKGQRQLLGSWLVVWDDPLPEYPADLACADAERVADASYGGSRGPVGA